MTEQKTWGEVGREVLKKLKGLTDEASINALGEETMQQVLTKEPTPEGRVNAVRMISREITNKKNGFPRLDSEAPNYWHDPKGKKSEPKWRHLIFKTITSSTSDSDEVGDAARQEWKAQQQKEVKQQSEEEEEPLTLDELYLHEFQLDVESQQLVKDALSLSGMTLADFTRQALRVYAKTVTGKTRKHGEDLSAVPTEKLLADPTYSTHPGRAEELTKRAIRAIAFYNTSVATENAHRWMITQSAIASLIGSRQSTIKEIMPKYQTSIDENNNRPEWALNPYSNRKPGKKIEEIIKLSELCPDGLE